MKTYTIVLAMLLSVAASAQTKLPSINIQNIDFETFNTLDIANEDKPVVISFWATWCSPCKAELNAISDEWPEWEDTGVKIYIVSIDNSRSVNSVQPYVYGQDWPFTTLLDVNSEFRRAMNVNNVPHTFLLNGSGEIVWQHNGYNPGDEEELLELVRRLVNGEEI